jgi:hypothetical protein
MSKVISFRLNPDNPLEAQALEILRTKQTEGFTSRRILTDALIGMDAKRDQDTLLSIKDFNSALAPVVDLLKGINEGNRGEDQSSHSQASALNDNFLSSVKVAAKPGLSLE